MKNIFWYISLAVIGVSSAVYAIYMKRNKYKISTLFVFYLLSASLPWTSEFIVLGLLIPTLIKLVCFLTFGLKTC